MQLEDLCINIPDNVQWHDGMLLSSQHFQTFDHYHSSLSTAIGRFSNCFNYGIVKLEINESAISSGNIQINKIYGILKDGTVINYNSATADYKLEFNVSESLQKYNKTRVYLCVLKHQHGDNNFSQNMPRYISLLNEDVKDENTGDNPINIPSKKPKFFLESDKGVLEKLSYIPILEIEKNNNIIRKTDFVPPYIYVTKESAIYNLVSDLIKQAKQKVGYILTKKNLRKDNYTIDAALRTLASYSMIIESLLNTEFISPFEIYKYLLEFTANILGFAISNVVPILPNYDHYNIVECIKTLIDYIEKSLTQIIELSSAIPFILTGNIFSLKLIKDWDSKENLLVGIKRANQLTKDEFITWINGAQIVCESLVEDIKHKRVLGANRNIIDSSEIGFENLHEDMIVLKIPSESQYIKLGENLCIFNESFTNLPEEIVFFEKESK